MKLKKDLLLYKTLRDTYNGLLSTALMLVLSLTAFGQCMDFTPVKTKLMFGEGPNAPVVKAWRYGDFATVVLVPGVNVNPDGSPRAYSVGNLGLVDIQNGVKILANGTALSYDAYQKKYGHPFTKHWLEAERKGFAVGTREFDAFALYSGGKVVGNGKGSPKVQEVPNSPIRYYISMTKTRQGDYPESDQRAYLDSGKIPAFVVPGTPKNTAWPDPLTKLLGQRQLAWAYYPSTNRSTYAIGGDTGPARKFGEATIAFHQLLRFGEIRPIPAFRSDANYAECKEISVGSTLTDCLYPGFVKFGAKGRIKTTSLPNSVIFVFFDKSEKVLEETITNEIIKTNGKVQMEKIGGEDMVMTCLARKSELKDVFKK